MSDYRREHAAYVFALTGESLCADGHDAPADPQEGHCRRCGVDLTITDEEEEGERCRHGEGPECEWCLA